MKLLLALLLCGTTLAAQPTPFRMLSAKGETIELETGAINALKSDETILALVDVVRAAGHHCESVTIADYLYFSSVPGFKLVCNVGAYVYTIRNPDGNGYVVRVEE
jgi:hypothetical protein